jgi:alpha-tubulin suppressor-like RCC1 family protein
VRGFARTLPPLLVCAGNLSCEPVPATQVIVRFSADAELRPRAARLEVDVWTHEGELVLSREKSLSGSEPELARVPIVPRDEDASRHFTVRGELFDASGASLGVERASATYVEDELSEILLVFESACSALGDCGEGRRCHGGACVGACVDATPKHAEREAPPRCAGCERCAAGRCEPLEDGASCGCAGDRCVAGRCEVARPLRSVALGTSHTCALAVTGGAYCWGSNEAGQLGLGTSSGQRAEPTFVLALETFWRGVHGESDTTCVLGGDEVRRCWGDNGFGQYGDGTTGPDSSAPLSIATPALRELSAGGGHYCGLEASGKVYCWGYNEHGQAGARSGANEESTPREIAAVEGARLVDAGGQHTCAIGPDDSLWCWGYNDSGQIGVGDLVDRETPVRPGCDSGQSACFDDWQTVALGSFHTCGIRLDGSLWCWGGNANSQLGVGTTGTNERAPLPVGQARDWTAVAAGYQHTCAIRNDGSLWCWGYGELGQLGNGARDRRNLPTRVASPPGSERWEQVTVAGGAGPGGGAHTCAIRSDRTLWCWGSNGSAQLGLGFASEEPILTPRRVCLPPP